MAQFESNDARATIEVDNRLLGAGPRKRGIDEAVRHAFTRVSGEWKVTLSEVRHFSPPWWWVSADGGRELLELCFPPTDQKPELVRERLVEVLKGHALVE